MSEHQKPSGGKPVIRPGETVILAGVPAEEAELLRSLGVMDYMPPHDSVKMPCYRCRRRAWIGPRQRAMLRDRPDSQVVCMICAAAAVNAGERIRMAGHLGGGAGASVTFKDGTTLEG